MGTYKQFLDYLIQQHGLKDDILNNLSYHLAQFEALFTENRDSQNINKPEEETPEEATKRDDKIETLFNTTALAEGKNFFPADFLEKTQKRYLILENLGEGGMGVVQKVKDQLLSREVALKTIKKEIFSDLSAKQKTLLWRLQREASITAILEHPNIIPIYDMQITEKSIQFTMRKVEGETLRDILLRQRNTPSFYENSYLLSIFLKVCDAISYAHSRGVVHRDLKPDNIMVGQFGEVYVMDWGIAKKTKVESSEETSEIDVEKNFRVQTESGFLKTVGGIGTPGYMSPEQRLHGANVTHQSDIYSLGIILQQLFTLYSPFEKFQFFLNELKQQTTQKKEPVLSEKFDQQFDKNIPKDVQAIVKKATEENVSARYESVKELSKDVELYLKNFRISVREYSLKELLFKWVLRNKKTVQIVCSSVVVVSLIIYMITGWHKYQTIQKQQERLQYWLEVMHAPQKGDREMALLEISKMSAPETLKLLFPLLEQGTQYFATETQRTNEQTQFYLFIPELIGSLGNTLAKDPLIKQFAPLLKKFEKKSQKKHFYEEELYLVGLVNALKDIQAIHISHWLDDMRHYIGMNSGFALKTEEAYLRLGMLDNFSEQKSNTARSYGRRGHLFYHLKNYKKSIAYYDKAILLDPQNESFYSWRGLAKFDSNHFNEAILDYDQAIKMDPTYESAYINRGIAKFKLDDFEGALADLNQAISLAPQEAEIYVNRGTIYLQQKQFDKAIADYEEAIRLDSQLGMVYQNLSFLYYKKSDLAQAIEHIQRALRLDPYSAMAYTHRGNIKIKQGEVEHAIADFTEAIRLDPQLAEAYLSRGDAKILRGNFSDALGDIEDALRLKPTLPDVWKTRSKIRFLLKDWDGALSDANEALRLEPRNDSYYVNRGHIFWEKKDLNAALSDYDHALKQNPKNEDAYSCRGNVKRQQGDFAGALADFDEAVRLNSQELKHFLNRGMLKKEMKNFSEAVLDFTTVLRLAPKNLVALRQRGDLLIALGQPERAILDYTQAIELDPKESLFYGKRGEAKNMLKRFREAIDDFKEATRLNPEDTIAFYNIGYSHFRLGEFDPAITNCQKALQLDSQFFSAYYCLGYIYQKKGDPDSAIQAFIEGLKIRPAPPIIDELSKLLFSRCVKYYREKEFQKAKEDLLHLKKYIPENHPQKKRVEDMLIQIEKQLKPQ